MQEAYNIEFEAIEGYAEKMTACSSSSNVLANQACTSEVLLQTLVVALQNGNHKSLERALIDTGSQKSYILKSTAENLGFKVESQPDNFETMVLGLIWNLKDDCLSCNINYQKSEGKAITKRSLLSIANHNFDPIGFTAPVTLKPKLILQEIWKLKLKWDESLPEVILNQVKQ
ncbi:uncharacterized protein TNCV_4698181 [Trichonephila clavipes]|nr:uncharacterized protein TNCV_4698181 [Trichonephila clavipes]